MEYEASKGHVDRFDMREGRVVLHGIGPAARTERVAAVPEQGGFGVAEAEPDADRQGEG